MTKFTGISMPNWLFDEIEKRRKALEINRSEYINMLIAKAIINENNTKPTQISNNGLTGILTYKSIANRRGGTVVFPNFN